MLRAVLSSVTAPPAPALAKERQEAWWRRIRWWRLAPSLAALALGIVYLVWEPRTVDMAAHVYRADLFGREGFTIWNGQWYGGHHTPAYSVLSPPLAWLLTPAVALVLASVASAATFEALVRNHFGEQRARWGALWFGLGTGQLLFTSRLPFALGVAFALAALLALQRRRYGLALLLAILCPLGSPVAGLFLAMAGVAYALAARGEDLGLKRAEGVAMAAAAFIPPVFLNWAFPEGGWAPFPFSAYLPIPVFAVAAFFLLPKEQHVLRVGTVLYGAGSTLAVLLETPMGGNAVRLGSLVGGPLLVCALSGRWQAWRRPAQAALAVAFLGLAVWQWSAPVRDVSKYLEDPAAKADYFKPLREYLKTLPDQRRIEIPFTRSHWESAEIADVAPLARGWLRQIDTGQNPIFYKGPLNRLTYASWLAENAVRYVALPGALPDKAAYTERALIENGLPYLRLRRKVGDWRVYEVILPAPFVISEGSASMALEQLGSDRVLLRVTRPGTALVRARWTPYWLAHGGCVEKARNWIRVSTRKTGFLELTTRFSPERLVERGRRCDAG